VRSAQVTKVPVRNLLNLMVTRVIGDADAKYSNAGGFAEAEELHIILAANRHRHAIGGVSDPGKAPPAVILQIVLSLL
jgi:hypothetical protein